jgi:hypothetical protein
MAPGSQAAHSVEDLNNLQWPKQNPHIHPFFPLIAFVLCRHHHASFIKAQHAWVWEELEQLLNLQAIKITLLALETHGNKEIEDEWEVS